MPHYKYDNTIILLDYLFYTLYVHVLYYIKHTIFCNWFDIIIEDNTIISNYIFLYRKVALNETKNEVHDLSGK